MQENGKKRLLRVAYYVFGMTRKSLGTYASSTAFFFFLSLIPILVLLSSLIPFTRLSEEAVLESLMSFVPGMVRGLFAKMAKEAFSHSGALVPISLVTMLWSAGKGMMALNYALNEAYEVEERRNYLLVRILGAFYTAMLLLLIVAVLFLAVFGGFLRDFVVSYFPDIPMVATVLSNSRYLFLWGLAILIFMVVYAFVPDGRRSFPAQFPGAVFASSGWAIFSWIFSRLIGTGTNLYSVYYGSLATLAVLLIWLYGCIYILIIGAYINWALEEEG